MSLETRRFSMLNETATLIWEALCEGVTPDEIAARLAAVFEIAEPEAIRHVEDFIAELHRAGLVRPVG